MEPLVSAARADSEGGRAILARPKTLPICPNYPILGEETACVETAGRLIPFPFIWRRGFHSWLTAKGDC